jgi:3-deoxy-7-phosphoheptulonate synthase / chorismate mutase
MNDPHSHAPIHRLRDEISDVDRTILDAINARLALVAELKRYKEEQGIPFVDPDRERQLLGELVAANTGPLSESGLREVFSELLDLMKREVSRDDAASR